MRNVQAQTSFKVASKGGGEEGEGGAETSEHAGMTEEGHQVRNDTKEFHLRPLVDGERKEGREGLVGEGPFTNHPALHRGCVSSTPAMEAANSAQSASSSTNHQRLRTSKEGDGGNDHANLIVGGVEEDLHRREDIREVGVVVIHPCIIL